MKYKLKAVIGNHLHESMVYILHKPTGVIGCVGNSSCTADAYKLFAEVMRIENDGVFMTDCKVLYPNCKAHQKVFNAAGIQVTQIDIDDTEKRALQSIHLTGTTGNIALTGDKRKALFHGLIEKGLLTKSGRVTRNGIQISGPLSCGRIFVETEVKSSAVWS